MKKGRVFVAQVSKGKNLLDAERFGKPIACLSESESAYLCEETMVKKLENALSTFSDEDYLLLIGSPIAIGICTALAAKANEGRVAVLNWDRQTARYYEAHLQL